MHSVYKHADGKKINDRRIVLDVERGRTVKSWKPQRLGGGLGGARNGAAEVNVRHSGRVENFERNANGKNVIVVEIIVIVKEEIVNGTVVVVT